MATSYIPLHSHSSYTNGAFGIREFVEYAGELDFNSIALTDQNLFGAPEFFIETERLGIKPILGAEIGSLIILVEDRKGYKNLSKIVTKNCIEKIDMNFIAENSDGLIFISHNDENLLFLRKKGISDRNLFISIQPENLYKISQFRPLAMNEILYLRRSDFEFYRLVKAIRAGTFISKDIMGINYLLKQAEVSALFKDRPEAVKNTIEIAERCSFDLKRDHYHLPGANHALLIKILEPIKNNLDPKMKQRLNYELQLIEKLNFSGIFIAAFEIGRFAHSSGITINLRGSANSSLILNLFGLSLTNPVRFNLPFERFLNEGRSEPPDIDIDVEYHRRSEIFNFIKERFGKENTAQISTIIRFRSRSAFRETCLAFGISPDELRKIELNSGERIFKKIKSYASRLQNLPKNISVHIGGIVIAPSRIDEFVPLFQSNSSIITHYDKEGIDYIGLVKIDILGVRGFPAIAPLINSPPDEDKDVFDLIGQGKTIGCFQIESPPMRSLLVKLKPKKIEEIAFALALIRPGATDSGMKGTYLKHCGRGESVDYFPPSIAHILKDTGGIPVYQEQILEIASTFAGFSLSEADALRRAMTRARRREPINLLKENFFSKAQALGHSSKDIERVWKKIQDFANFGFNKAHSIAYGTLAYLSAYTKRYYPTQFFASVLSNHGGYYSTCAYIEEARRWGIKILPPDVNLSGASFKPIDGKIVIGLAEIKNLTAQTIHRITEQQPFTSCEEFFNAVMPDIDEGISLIKSGALDTFKIPRPVQFFLLLAYLKSRKYTSQHKLIEQEKILRPLIFTARSISPEKLFSDQYEVLNCSPSCHPLRIIKPNRNHFITELREGQKSTIWGMVIAQRVIRDRRGEPMAFLTLDDETGIVEAVLWSEVYRRFKNRINPILGLKGTYKDQNFIIEEIINSLSI